jgi:hypothetical protein
MQRIMGAHSDVFAGPEFDFVPTQIIELRDNMLRSIRSGRIEAILDEQTLDHALASFVCGMFEERLKRAGKSVFCEKTPANALAFPDLEKFLPDARHIMMVRDPRDVANSMRTVRDKFISNGQRPPRFVRSIAASVQEINRFYDAGLSAAERSDKVLLIYYEDLISDPIREIRRVCDHTGLTYQPEMQHIEQKTFVSPSSGDENWYSQSDLQQPIQSSGVVSKKFSLSKSEITLVERFSLENPALARYKLRPSKPTLWENILWRASLARKAGVLLPRRRFK